MLYFDLHMFYIHIMNMLEHFLDEAVRWCSSK